MVCGEPSDSSARSRLETRLVAADDSAWLEFVGAQSAATPFHHVSWTRLLEECYGYRSFALVVHDASGRIAGGLPIVDVVRRRSRRRWVSLPFTDHFPPLVTTPAVVSELPQLLDATRREHEVSSLVVRDRLSDRVAHVDNSSVRHTLALPEDFDAAAKGFVPPLHRNLRRASKVGLQVRPFESEADVIDGFYPIHLATRRRLGVPIQPRRLFRLVWRHLLESGLGFGLLVSSEQGPVAAGIFLAWNGTVVCKYSASYREAWPSRPNDLMFASAIRWGIDHECHTFDFGRTDVEASGLRRFKRGFGAIESPASVSTLGVVPSGRLRHALEAGMVPVLQRAPSFVTRATGELFYRYAA